MMIMCILWASSGSCAHISRLYICVADSTKQLCFRLIHDAFYTLCRWSTIRILYGNARYTLAEVQMHTQRYVQRTLTHNRTSILSTYSTIHIHNTLTESCKMRGCKGSILCYVMYSMYIINMYILHSAIAQLPLLGFMPLSACCVLNWVKYDYGRARPSVLCVFVCVCVWMIHTPRPPGRSRPVRVCVLCMFVWSVCVCTV